ncbi:hypothetical protein [Flavobacterium sp.]|uniref:hypothetical protein n=1 Tax=Flavobacterium sp. TaxID=239 RepID=UPI0037BE7B8B
MRIIFCVKTKGIFITTLKGVPARFAGSHLGDLFKTLMISEADSTFGNSKTLIFFKSPNSVTVNETTIFPALETVE